MKKIIERLRQEPKAKRQKVAFGTALVTTFLIAIIWLSVLVTRFDGSVQTAQSSEANGPITSIIENFQNAFSGMDF